MATEHVILVLEFRSNLDSVAEVLKKIDPPSLEGCAPTARLAVEPVASRVLSYLDAPVAPGAPRSNGRPALDVHIELGNDAMLTGHDLADALVALAGRLRSSHGISPARDDAAIIRDVNDNNVGSWNIS